MIVSSGEVSASQTSFSVMAPMPASQDADADFLVLELFELLADRLDGAAEVGLEDDLELGDLGLGQRSRA